MNLSKKRFFVTGGAGFIGSSIVGKLLKIGSAAVYDNLSSGRDSFITKHFENQDFKFFKGDLLDINLLKKVMKRHDVVFHFAANSDVLCGIEKTNLDFEQGALATYNVLEAMRFNNIKNIVFSSSGTVWGLTGNKKANEDSPLKPISLYAASKVAAESYIRAFCHIFGFKAWIFRFSNVVGDKQTHGVIYDFILKLRKNPGELTILGNGKQTKHYLHVSDCIAGILFGIEKGNDEVNVFNLASEGTMNVNQIADIVVQALGLKDVKYIYTGGSQGWRGDVPVSLFSAEKIKKLGWKPRFNSEEAVKEAINDLLDDKYDVFKSRL